MGLFQNFSFGTSSNEEGLMKMRKIALLWGWTIVFGLGIFFSCDSKSTDAADFGGEGRDYIRQVSLDGSSLDGSSADLTEVASPAAVEAAFTLDYRPQRPEPESPAETLSAAFLSGSAGTGEREGTQIIPGLRRLEDYQTPYFDPLKNGERIRAIGEAQAASGGVLSPQAPDGRVEEPLTVVDWGPRDFYSSAVQRPSLFVIFSQPMVPLASLGQPSKVSPIVSISPALKGSFRWYGTGFLSFEADEPCQSQQVYTITVEPSATSIYGQRISGETRFSFETETLAFKKILPGEEFKKQTRWYFPDNEVPPEAARQITLVFNYPVTAENIAPFLEISTRAGGVKGFTLTQTAPDTLLADLRDLVEFDTELRVTLKRGAKSGGTGASGGSSLGTKTDQVRTFRTPGPFGVEEIAWVSPYGKYLNLTTIRFTHRLNEKTIPGNIRLEPPIPLTADNIEIAGSMVWLYNLPVAYGDTFTVIVGNGAEDVYGRKLPSPHSGVVQVPPPPQPRGDVTFLNYHDSHEMLEAQFDPRYLFEYKNIAPNSWYEAASQNNPYSSVLMNPRRVNLVPGELNTRYFEEIDLKPFLTPLGKGFISFRAHMELLTNRKIKGSERYEIDTLDRNFSIQVTDLGLSVRYGFNKTAVLVTSLTTGEPVEGATVRLLSPGTLEDKGLEDISGAECFGEGRTDKQGFVVIATPAGVLREKTLGSSRYYFSAPPYVFAEKDGDRAVFQPSSHNAWAQGINTGLPQRAEEIAVTTFLFSDRGLYKPGEVLTFRGVDRTLVLGMYTIYTGPYTVTLEEDRYRGEKLLEISGTASESGGFYGSLTIPDDAVPGSYRLTYRREGREGISANVPVTVAFFERLKFQASLTVPALPVISGDDVNAALRASYLSGGSLSGSTYESSWYRELSWFRPQNADTRAFSFGPRNGYDAKRHIASAEGMLSADGAASLSQKTGDGLVEGAPYRYSVEARVTDISNQMIAASASVMVHPGRFYIGLAPEGRRGFARLGEELSFDYITVDPEGSRLTNTVPFLSGGSGPGSLKVELVREEWRRVQQQGVGGYIYDEYLWEPVTDIAQELPLKPGGTIRVKPSQAGFYTLRLSSADREGRRVLTEYGFYVTGGRGGYWNMNDPGELRLTPDQDQYNPGDTAQILLQSVLPAGWYLITVEREGIFTEEVRHFEDSVSVFEVPIARNYVPVVYVSISSYSVRSGPPSHEYGSPDLDKPKGYFGVTKLLVDPRVRAFSVKAESDKKSYRPGEEVTMTLTAEQDGKPLANAELTLMAVDRGVLDLIGYHVPDPIRHFYNESLFPLSVRGGDSRAELMDPVTYNVKNLAGGDSEGESKLEERKDFNPTAVFEPMLVTDRNGQVRCTFKLPDSLTTYRITVFGVRGDLFSLKETEIAAQNRINLREVLPRRLRERDTAEAGVLITNLDSASHKITVALSIGEVRQELNNPSGRIKQAGAARVDGPAEHSLTVKSGENAVVYFDVAAVREGSVSLNFTLTSDILNERLVQELVIEKPYVKETVTTLGIIPQAAGQAIGQDTGFALEGLVIPSFADNGAGALTVSLDATRLGLLNTAVDYLFRYPYGCLEQRSAAVMPLAVFGEYLEVFGLKGEVSDPKAVVANEIKDWARLQRPDGGFPYWPSGLESDFYVSLRIGHIYAIAQSKGIPLPASFNREKLYAYLNGEYQKLQDYQRLQSRQGNSGGYFFRSYLQAYMLYVFSLLNQPVDASRLAEILGRPDADPAVLAFAGMSYRNIGRPREAAAAAERLRNLLRPTARGTDLTDPGERSQYAYYGGPVEQLALTLEFFAAQFPGDPVNTRLLFSLLEKKRTGGFWNNTAVTVRVLLAVDAFIRSENLADTDPTVSLSLAGQELLSGAFRGLAAEPLSRGIAFTAEPLAGLSRDTLLPLRISRQGTGSLAYTASLTYALPPELQFFRDEGLGVFMTLEDVSTGEEVTGTALLSGKTYRARIRVSSGRDRTYLALRVPIPSGAEILDAAFAVTSSYGDSVDRREESGYDPGRNPGYNRSRVSFQTILDNEIQYFWDNFYKGESTVEFLFRTVRRGVFPTPPVQAECMYEPEIFGRSGGALFTIE
jgi:uncharacterized protein YfaS (alpha-2-macroglobulin family)